MVAVYALCVCYCLMIVLLTIGWIRTMRRKPEGGQAIPISVVVAFRNEATNLKALFNSLEHQTHQSFEVILVDDHSEDDSLMMVSEWKDRSSLPVRVLSSTGEGKKHALAMGIASASHALLATTDADCSVAPDWLEKSSLWFAGPEVHLVAGGVRLAPTNTFFSSLQAIEFSALVGSGASTLGFGISTLCNGANLMFRKSTFIECNGYEGNDHLASGDDEFLMRKIHARYPTGIVFNSLAGTVVSTPALDRWSDFLNQRVRWASKWRHQAPGAVALALLVWLSNAAFAIVLVQFILSPGLVGGALLMSRLLLEWQLLKRYASFFMNKVEPASFLTLHLLYPVYAVVFGLLANLVPFRWKGRKYLREGNTKINK